MMTPEEIAALRKALGLTPTQFAAAAGVSASTVCYWEKGKKHPSYKKAVRLNELRDELMKGRNAELAGA